MQFLASSSSLSVGRIVRRCSELAAAERRPTGGAVTDSAPDPPGGDGPVPLRVSDHARGQEPTTSKEATLHPQRSLLQHRREQLFLTINALILVHFLGNFVS